MRPLSPMPAVRAITLVAFAASITRMQSYLHTKFFSVSEAEMPEDFDSLVRQTGTYLADIGRGLSSEVTHAVAT